VQPHLAAANRAAIEAQMFAGSSVRNALVIESMGMLEHIHSRWLKRQRLFLGAQATASDHAAGLAATARSIQLLQGSVLLGLACWLLLAGEFPGGGGMMIVASVIGGIALRPLVQAIAHWKQFVAARDAFQRLDALLTQMPARPPQMPLPAPQGQLSVEAVTVGAPTGGGALPLPILRNVSFAIPKGECLGVIGPSASGKTTLARLLTGVWPAQSGNVRLDGVDVYSWNKAELGPHVGYLPEQVELFEGTLADNITRFGGVDQQKLEEAVRLVGLESWVAELPQAYDTQIGDEGTTLSAGQRQRVGLARAIYGNPCFVVLDEPNSNLDEQGENVLLELLRELKRRAVTCVIITHRVNVLSVVDSILVLRDGVVQGLGKRDEVLAALSAAAKGAVPSRGGGDALPAPARAEGAA
jgi:ATP-binding cassette subfamily C exporter for protease/lipase